MKKAVNIGSTDDRTLVKIVDWANERNIIEGTTSAQQLEKFFEECGELARAVAEKDLEALKDAIGDVIVVATVIAAQNGLTTEECIDHAYNEIKDRKGKVVNGVFVKEDSASLVTISKEELRQFQENEDWVQALEAAGVDNWDGIDTAIDIFDARKNHE